MLFAFVTAVSVSLGSISVEAHPGARLLDAPVLEKMPLPELQIQLDMELHKPSPFVAPAVALGVGVLGGGLGTLFAFTTVTWKTLLAAGGFYLLGAVGLIAAIVTLAQAVGEQSARNQRITQLRDEIAKRKRTPGYPEELSPPPLPPVETQYAPPVISRVVLAHF